MNPTKFFRSISVFLFIALILVVPVWRSQNQSQVLAAGIPELPKVDPDLSSAPLENLIVSPAVEVTSSTSANLNLQISSIGLNIPLGETHLDAQGHLMVPANPKQAAWYADGPQVGQPGTAIVTGHLDSAAGPGVFYNLRQLKIGEQIEVRDETGKKFTFQINKLTSYPQDATFPWNQVYNTTGPASLRLITCDGIYSKFTGHYNRNLVVYARLVGIN